MHADTPARALWAAYAQQPIGAEVSRFGEILRKCRRDRGYSLRAFARAVGISPTYLSLMERGRAPPPSALIARRIAEEFGEPVGVWLTRAGRSCDDLLRGGPPELKRLVITAAALRPKALRALLAQARALAFSDKHT